MNVKKKWDVDDYFQNESNKEDFLKKLLENQEYIYYYQYYLHNVDSDYYQVNYVSSTENSKITLNESEHDKVVFLFWIPHAFSMLRYDEVKFKIISNNLKVDKLPTFEKPYYPGEYEHVIRGCIFPSFILCVLDISENYVVFNPKIEDDYALWVEDGFDIDIDQINFRKILKSTNYNAGISLTNNKLEDYKC